MGTLSGKMKTHIVVIFIFLGLLLALSAPVYALADSGTATVSGTEYQVGDNGTVYAHVLYLNGTPANSATLNLTLWRPNGTKELDTVSMTFITGSNGIYLYNFTVPSIVGVYVADIVSTNPTGYGSDEVHVATAVNLTCENVTCNISANVVWNASMAGYTNSSTFGGALNELLGGGNVSLLGVLGLCIALMVIGFWRKSQAIMWIAALAWIGLAFWQRSLTPAWGTWDLHEMLFYIGFLMTIVCIVEAVMIYREEQPEPKERVPALTPIERYRKMRADLKARTEQYGIRRRRR